KAVPSTRHCRLLVRYSARATARLSEAAEMTTSSIDVPPSEPVTVSRKASGPLPAGKMKEGVAVFAPVSVTAVPPGSWIQAYETARADPRPSNCTRLPGATVWSGPALATAGWPPTTLMTTVCESVAGGVLRVTSSWKVMLVSCDGAVNEATDVFAPASAMATSPPVCDHAKLSISPLDDAPLSVTVCPRSTLKVSDGGGVLIVVPTAGATLNWMVPAAASISV